MPRRTTPPRLLPGHPVPGRPFRYSQDSTILPATAQWLLLWAAAHVEKVGLFQGDGLFATGGRTVTLPASMLGVLDVAGGDGRRSSRREYDPPAVRAARALALVLLSDHVNGGPVEFPQGADEEEQRRLRYRVVHVWGRCPGRTAAEAAQAFRAAADRCGA
ncbi:DUF6197 family protein [Kitasatospora sp. NPDC088548]|uniref:DUF6197 family protein n=1 Tax=Kitasatospora sp. NPDC088548 TaxID=3364075 RepID=UPI00380E34B3